MTRASKKQPRPKTRSQEEVLDILFSPAMTRHLLAVEEAQFKQMERAMDMLKKAGAFIPKSS